MASTKIGQSLKLINEKIEAAYLKRPKVIEQLNWQLNYRGTKGYSAYRYLISEYFNKKTYFGGCE